MGGRETTPTQKIMILCGPTASGKTAAALALARRFPIEIVSADSGQIYKGMDIGTAKPTVAERGEIPFHLIDILDPSEPFSAAQFARLADEAISGIIKRDRRPLIVGGTGLYIKVLLGGIFEGPERDPVLRARLEEEFLKKGPQALHRCLKKIDPEAAAAIPPGNRHRLIRALEVFEKTGRPISSLWKEHEFRERRYEAVKIGLTLPEEEYTEKINERVDRMFSAGLVEETKQLLQQWGREAPGFKLIGYQETVEHLDGKMSRDECLALIKRHTRQYAKRQKTWFRRDSEIDWISAHDFLDKASSLAKYHEIFY